MASNTKSRPAERMPRIAPENMTEAQKKAAAELAAGPRGELRGPFMMLAMIINMARTALPAGKSPMLKPFPY